MLFRSVRLYRQIDDLEARLAAGTEDGAEVLPAEPQGELEDGALCRQKSFREELRRYKAKLTALINERDHDIELLVALFLRNMPMSVDAVMALNAMLIARSPLWERFSGHDPQAINYHSIKGWLTNTSRPESDTAFATFLNDVEYLIERPLDRYQAAVYG